MLNQPPEQPLYVAYESTKRALIPKVVTLLFLAFIFYIGVLVNISLLELDAAQETNLKTGALLVLGILIVVGIALTFKKSRQPYLFYRNRIVQGKETLYYLDITNTSQKINFLDNIFKTYFIQLGKNFFLRNISQSIALNNYVQQLIEYARKNQ